MKNSRCRIRWRSRLCNWGNGKIRRRLLECSYWNWWCSSWIYFWIWLCLESM